MTTAGRSPGRGARSAATASATIVRSAAWKRAVANRSAASTHAAGSTVVGIEPRDDLGERLGVAAPVVRPRLPLVHALEHAAGAERDHRPAGRERLHGGDPELLGRGHDERAGAPHQLGDAHVRQPAGEAHGRPGEAAQPPQLGAVADHHERRAEPVERVTATSIRLCAISSATTR